MCCANGARARRRSNWLAATRRAISARERAQPFDLVFLDPPFAGDAWREACAAANPAAGLRRGALIYVERPRDAPLPALPAAWQALRSGTAGAVGYHLYQRS